jgi:hypothetical protein
VYSEDDKNKLKTNASGNWSVLNVSTPDGVHELFEEDNIVFEDIKDTPDTNLLNELQEQYISEDGNHLAVDNDIIDIDDI